MAREIIDSAAALSVLAWEWAHHYFSDRVPAMTPYEVRVGVDAEIARLKSARGDARLQLYEGPSARESCDLSWEQAVEVLRDWWRDNGQDLWVHEDDPSDICTSQPEHDHVCDDECRSDGCWYNYDDQYRCVDAGVVGRVIFSDELFDYIK